MKYLFTAVSICLLVACANRPIARSCLGDTKLPAELAGNFEPVDDEELLNKALGNPDEGKLCRGQVYQSKAETQVAVYRAWNSTNPHSKFGGWWAFQRPEGKVSSYRADYEICYQWSPLDKLVACTLDPGVKVVVGTGQSARCSQYLTYPVSDKRQVFIESASNSVSDCLVYDGNFSWERAE